MKKRNATREVRAVLWLLPVLGVVSWLVWAAARTNLGAPSDTADIAAPAAAAGSPPGEAWQAQPDGVVTAAAETAADAPASLQTAAPADSLFVFDPNTVEYHDLVRLGFGRGEALGIVKYRARGKVFEIAEDFAACYQVSEAMYRRLAPYIRIGERYRLRPFERRAAPSYGAGRDGPSSLHGAGRADTAAVPARRPLVDLNTADSATLRSVSGIGPATVGAIMRYRERLGGFADVRQLADVRGVTPDNLARIITQVVADPAAVRRIAVNTAPTATLAAHPCIGPEAARRLARHRALHGPWRGAEDLAAAGLLTPDSLARLVPYLDFN